MEDEVKHDLTTLRVRQSITSLAAAMRAFGMVASQTMNETIMQDRNGDLQMRRLRSFQPDVLAGFNPGSVLDWDLSMVGMDAAEPQRVSAAQIHAELYAGADADLLEPDAFLDEPPVASDRVLTLKRMGFSEQEEVKEFVEVEEAYGLRQAVHQTQTLQYRQAMDYALRFPAYKFISSNSLTAVTLKYGLQLRHVSEFTGKIPDKNVAEMARFCEQTTFTEADNDTMQGPDYLIAAPPDQFVQRYRRPASFQQWLLDDPIVLRPLPGGYLIVTCWGEEASDPDVLNERNN